MREWIEKFHKAGLLRVIDEPCDIDLEIAHTSYIEVKKSDSKALLFTHPTDKNGKKYPPVWTNIFGSFEALKLIFGRNPDEIACEIENLLKPKKAQNFKEKLEFLSYLISLRKVFTTRFQGKPPCEEVVKKGKDVDLGELPILKTWSKDAGAFITMGQIYTKSLNGETQNLGMYRLQVHSKNELGMHWQIHKDGANFYNEYKKLGLKMPVSVAIGGDPLYTWCAQAPLPKGVFELLLYGFIRKNPARLVRSLTNDILIPYDSDFVIEGYVDTAADLINEGPFGDHTGFYTPVLPFPVMKVGAITYKKDPIFLATVVGKPPLEDKFMGYATERIFLPLFKTSAPDLIDYKMPENGVFHNLILAKIKVNYPGAAKQIMHAFWGVGQMSFVKHAVFADENAPKLTDYENFTRYVLNRFGVKSLFFSEGICDELDHASPNALFGGKLGIDVTNDFSGETPEILSDMKLLDKFHSECECINDLKQYFTDTKNPIVLINISKDRQVSEIFTKILKFKKNFKILIFLDKKNDINNVYMSIWRITNNIDALRDIYLDGEQVCVDATAKGEIDGFTREWPDETVCDKEVIKKLIDRKIINNDITLFRKFEIL